MLERFDSRKTQSSRSNGSNNMMEPFNNRGVGSQLNRQNNNNGEMNIFSMHNSMMQQMDKQFQQVHQRMMKNFGSDDFFGGSLMNAFPSHSSSSFGMMDQISKHMDQMFSNFSDLHQNMLENRQSGPYTSMSKVFTMQRKVGPDNKVYEEKYFSNNLAQKDKSGNTISERHQGYKNDYDKRDMIAQERMLNNQGRKYVQERHNGQINSTNHYLNLDEDDAGMFDNAWNDMSQKMGFYNNQKSLGYGNNNGKQLQNRLRNNDNDYDDYSSNNSESSYSRNGYNTTQITRKPQQQYNQKNYKEYNFRDENRRGDYLPINARNSDQIVRLNNNNNNNNFDGYGRRATDLKPTQPQTTLNNQNNAITAGVINNNNNYNRASSFVQQPASQTSIPSSQINNNAQAPINRNQRASLSSIPARNVAEQGVFANRNNPKGALPRAG